MESSARKSKASVIIDKISSIVNARYAYVALIFYVVAIFWVLSFPLVNVSTGELKPRGLFVDENSLLVNSALPGQFKVMEIRSKTQPIESILPDGSVVTHYSLSSRFGAKSLESIVFIFPYREALNDSVSLLVNNIAYQLEQSRWLAKKVILVPSVITSDNLLSSAVIEQWLRLYHNYNASNSRLLANVGLIREAYVIDLTCLNSSTQSLLQFSSVELQYSGINGILPNMDMISYPLVTFKQMHKSWSVTTESDVDYLTGVYKSLVRLISGSPVLGGVLLGAMDVAYTAVSSLLPEGYFPLLSGAISSVSRLVMGPSGLHHHFLSRNIDAITLRFHAFSTSNSISGKSVSGAGVSAAHAGIESILNIIMRLAYISSNLHEELHHSFTYYLVMGPKHFVGLTEYGLVAGVMMLSLFTLYLHYAYQCSASRLLPAVASLAWDAWPPLVLLAAASTGTSAISHSWAVSVMGVVYSLHMLPIGGLSRASTTSDSDPCIVEYTTVVLTLLLCVFAWIAAQHFSLALLVYVVVMPSLALVCRLCPTVKSQTNIGITGNRVLELLSVVWSPCGVYLLLYWFENTIAMSHESLIARLLLDWRKFGSYVLPFALWVTSLVSNLANRVLLYRQSKGTTATSM